METIFMKTKNSKTSESHRFKLDSTDKLNLKNPKKKHGFSQFEYLLHLEKIYLIVLILLRISKITLNLSSKNIKL